MLKKTYKAKELAEHVSVAIMDCLEDRFKDITNIDCVMGVLLGATAIISSVHRSMSEDDCDELTAEMLAEWAAMYRKKMVKTPDSES